MIASAMTGTETVGLIGGMVLVAIGLGILAAGLIIDWLLSPLDGSPPTKDPF